MHFYTYSSQGSHHVLERYVTICKVWGLRYIQLVKGLPSKNNQHVYQMAKRKLGVWRFKEASLTAAEGDLLY